jgi:hypothetical protein
MHEHPHSELEPEATPQIDTPVIDIQDLEYQPSRVNTAGLKVRPKRDEPHLSDVPELSIEPNLPDDPMYAREDEKAREAVAKFEESLKTMPPD